MGAGSFLTGSIATNYGGVPRTTHDLDFVVELAPADAPRIEREFREGFYLDPAAVHAVFQPPHPFNAIDTRSALKVDVRLLMPAPFDQGRFRRRVRVTLLGEPAWIATAQDAVVHNLHWNQITPSERHLGDAAGVVAVQRGALDLAYLRKWAQELGATKGLEDLLSGRTRPKQT